MLFTQTCIAYIIIFGYSNVYFLPYDKNLEYFNEFCILVCIYHCYLFTDFVPRPEDRFIMGYSLIACTVFNFTINCGLMLIGTLS